MCVCVCMRGTDADRCRLLRLIHVLETSTCVYMKCTCVCLCVCVCVLSITSLYSLQSVPSLKLQHFNICLGTLFKKSQFLLHSVYLQGITGLLIKY